MQVISWRYSELTATDSWSVTCVKCPVPPITLIFGDVLIGDVLGEPQDGVDQTVRLDLNLCQRVVALRVRDAPVT